MAQVNSIAQAESIAQNESMVQNKSFANYEYTNIIILNKNGSAKLTNTSGSEFISVSENSSTELQAVASSGNVAYNNFGTMIDFVNDSYYFIYYIDGGLLDIRTGYYRASVSVSILTLTKQTVIANDTITKTDSIGFKVRKETIDSTDYFYYDRIANNNRENVIPANLYAWSPGGGSNYIALSDNNSKYDKKNTIIIASMSSLWLDDGSFGSNTITFANNTNYLCYNTTNVSTVVDLVGVFNGRSYKYISESSTNNNVYLYNRINIENNNGSAGYLKMSDNSYKSLSYINGSSGFPQKYTFSTYDPIYEYAPLTTESSKYPIVQAANFVNPDKVIGLVDGFGGILVGDSSGGITSVNPVITSVFNVETEEYTNDINTGQLLYTVADGYAFLAAPGNVNSVLQFVDGEPAYTADPVINSVNFGSTDLSIGIGGDDLYINSTGEIYLDSASTTGAEKLVGKTYIDNIASGLEVKQACDVMIIELTTTSSNSDTTFTATTETGTALMTYSDGVITAEANTFVNLLYKNTGGTYSAQLASGDRVLINNNYNVSNVNVGSIMNGIYVYTASTVSTVPYLTLAVDANAPAGDGQNIFVGMYTYIRLGFYSTNSYVLNSMDFLDPEYSYKFTLYQSTGLNVPGNNQLLISSGGGFTALSDITVSESDPGVSGFDNLTLSSGVLNVGGSTLSTDTLTTTYLSNSVGSIKIGDVSGNSSVAFGPDSYCDTANSVAIGNGASVDADNGVSIGNNASTNNTNSITIGNGAETNAEYCITIGDNALSESAGCIAIGGNDGDRAYADGVNSIAIGSNAISNGTNSVAIGTNSNATGTNSVSLNSSAQVSGESSIGILNTLALTTSYCSVMPASLLIRDDAGDASDSTNTYAFANNTSSVNCLSTPVFTQAAISDNLTDTIKYIVSPDYANVKFILNSFSVVGLSAQTNLSASAKIFTIEGTNDDPSGTTINNVFTPPTWTLLGTTTWLALSAYIVGDTLKINSFATNIAYGAFKIKMAIAGAINETVNFRPLLEGTLIEMTNSQAFKLQKQVKPVRQFKKIRPNNEECKEDKKIEDIKEEAKEEIKETKHEIKEEIKEIKEEPKSVGIIGWLFGTKPEQKEIKNVNEIKEIKNVNEIKDANEIKDVNEINKNVKDVKANESKVQNRRVFNRIERTKNNIGKKEIIEIINNELKN